MTFDDRKPREHAQPKDRYHVERVDREGAPLSVAVPPVRSIWFLDARETREPYGKAA